jgi:hypothetical protein
MTHHNPGKAHAMTIEPCSVEDFWSPEYVEEAANAGYSNLAPPHTRDGNLQRGVVRGVLGFVAESAEIDWWIDRAESAEAELDKALEEVARLRAGEADEPGDPAAVPTPAEAIRRWNDLPTDRRLPTMERLIESGNRAARCFTLNHDRRLASAEAEVERLRGSLDGVSLAVEQWESRAVAAEAKVADLHREWRTECDLRQEVQRLLAAAEAKVARVEALIPSQFEIDGGILIRPEALRAALADAPAEQRAEGGA